MRSPNATATVIGIAPCGEAFVVFIDGGMEQWTIAQIRSHVERGGRLEVPDVIPEYGEPEPT